MDEPKTNYQGNAKKNRPEEPKEKKAVEKVVTGDVLVQKKSLGRKIKDTFIEADFRSVGHYLFADILLPALKNLIVDSATKGIERTIYGEPAMRRRGFSQGPRVTYNAPIARTPRDDQPRRYGPSPALAQVARRSSQDFIFGNRADAEKVLESLNDIIDQYESTSVGDLNELVGAPNSHVDNKWGWMYLGDAEVRQVREGFLIDLPDPEQLQ